MDIEEQFEDLIELGEKVDTKEERVALLDKVKTWLKKYKYQLGIGFILIALIAFVNEKKAEIQESLTETKIVEKIVYKDRVINMDNFKCADLSKMYSIADKVVVYKKDKYRKLAKGLSLEDGYELYITEYKPLKGK